MATATLDELWDEMNKSRNSQPDRTAEEILEEVDRKYRPSGTYSRGNTEYRGSSTQEPLETDTNNSSSSVTTAPQPKTSIEKFNEANDRLNREAVGFQRPKGIQMISPMAWVGSVTEYLGKNVVRGVQDAVDGNKLRQASEELLATGQGNPDSIKAILEKHGLDSSPETVGSMQAVSQAYQEANSEEFNRSPEVQRELQTEQAGEDFRMAVEAKDAERQAELARINKLQSDTDYLMGTAMDEAQNNYTGQRRAEMINAGVQNMQTNIQGAMDNAGQLLGDAGYQAPQLAAQKPVEAIIPTPQATATTTTSPVVQPPNNITPDTLAGDVLRTDASGGMADLTFEEQERLRRQRDGNNMMMTTGANPFALTGKV